MKFLSSKFINKVVTYSFVIIIAFLSSCSESKQIISLSEKYPIIPTPKVINYGENELKFKAVKIITSDFKNESEYLLSYFKSQGINESSNGLSISIIAETLSSMNSNEAYKLQIDSDIRIWASTDKGAFYAIQTLKQILRKNAMIGILPKLTISDWPAFKIRGFMHDTGRNFQSVTQLKEQIEILAQYKYNVFHLHLTDNPGWRLESKIYPELQSDRATTRQKGNFYTQQDYKEILAFCKELKILVIPEFDIPGHTDAFRKAFKINEMRDPSVKSILLDLFQELIDLGNDETMPYIHIGTDEVREEYERVSQNLILELMQLIWRNNRDVIVWKEGVNVEKDSNSINQLWASHEEKKGHRFIDSRSNYVNHLDPFAGMVRLFYQQPARQPSGDSLALGGILATWPDNNIYKESDILIQNPIYPSMVFYSDAIWNGREKNYPEYWAKLPPKESDEFERFKTFEKKIITHRDLFFRGKPFQYVKQTDKEWKLIGPFDHQGNVEKIFPVEQEIKENYIINGGKFGWTNKHTGATIHLKHFFGFPAITEVDQGTYYAYTNIYSPEDRVQDFWIGFQGWSRSGGRRGGPLPNTGDWHTTKPKIWVNKIEIAPPVWKQPNLGTATQEIPFIDEDYFYRPPTKVILKKGWNKVLLKIPQDKNSWKWMFTCVPIKLTKDGVRGVNDLKYSTDFKHN